jgi:hypothetical protein
MNVTIDYLRALSGATGLTDTARVTETPPGVANRSPAVVEQAPQAR